MQKSTASNTNHPFLENELTTKSQQTFDRIVALRMRLSDAVEAGEVTGELRAAIRMLEDQCLRERADEVHEAVVARRKQAEAASARATELTTQARKAVSRTAEKFTIKE